MVKKTPKTDSEEIRDRFVHIAFTKTEKDDIKQHAAKANTTISEFVRQAIFDKILRIENPENFGDITTSEERLREIEERQKKQLELNQLILERLNVVNGINTTMDTLKNLISKEEMKEICDTIISMLKVHKTLPIEKLVILTSYKKQVIYDCIAVNPKLEINDEGEVYLNE